MRNLVCSAKCLLLQWNRPVPTMENGAHWHMVACWLSWLHSVSTDASQQNVVLSSSALTLPGLGVRLPLGPPMLKMYALTVLPVFSWVSSRFPPNEFMSGGYLTASPIELVKCRSKVFVQPDVDRIDQLQPTLVQSTKEVTREMIYPSYTVSGPRSAFSYGAPGTWNKLQKYFKLTDLISILFWL